MKTSLLSWACVPSMVSSLLFELSQHDQREAQRFVVTSLVWCVYLCLYLHVCVFGLSSWVCSHLSKAAVTDGSTSSIC